MKTEMDILVEISCLEVELSKEMKHVQLPIRFHTMEVATKATKVCAVCRMEICSC